MKTVKHGYKFTDKNNTKGGIGSALLALIGLVLLVTGVVISYKNDGNAGLTVGALGTCAFIVTTIGEIMGLRSFKEKDKFYLYSWIGTIINGILWACMCLIIAWGIVFG